MKKYILLLFLVTPFSGWSSTCATDIFGVINQRLSYMEDVALYKVNHQKAIEDIEREKTVIAESARSATLVGLDETSIAHFFSSQIAVAKAIQYRYKADLLSVETHRKPRDLNTHVRPQLIKLGNEINAKIANYLKAGNAFTEQQRMAFNEKIELRYVSTADKANLFDALQKIRLK
ncbi:chorismate mutase [Pseudoalteromonas sp. MSK9-3]|uniref:gamma subclass chorismate mutase AroQ n=1 Tax=Pseudoalteromonas sp. MSK9-3 TaxID=1897633 RepID=UPI000EDFD8E3|nr:gamma subclass chorismate mutase AroQ [Pseudoalteromonas sp. MSK9-3]RJE77103.1 chorismate mutase [Pseudoalteromonas sp. MSK9-3]